MLYILYTQGVNTSSASHVHHLVEFGVHHLVGLFEHLDEVPGLPAVLSREEGVGSAGLVRPPGAPYAVHVVLGTRGVVIVDNKLHIVDVC